MGQGLLDKHGNFRFTPLMTLLILVAGGTVLGIGIAVRNQDTIVAGGVVIFVALAGRFTTARNDKYADVALATPVPARPGSPMNTVVVQAGEQLRRRVVLTRRSGLANYTFIQGSAFCVVVVVVPGGPWSFVIVFAALGTALMMIGWLAGRAARFVITPTTVQIDTAFRSLWIPRSRIDTFEQTRTKARIRLTGGREYVDIRVDSPIHDAVDRTGSRTNPRTQVRTVAQIVAAMSDVPVSLTEPADIESARRPRLLAVTAVAGLLAFAATIIGAALVHGS